MKTSQLTPDCGNDSSVDNATHCVEDSEEFLQCDLPCPAGYHVEYYSTSSGCGETTSNDWNNQAYCALNEGTFPVCDTVCPAGWHVTVRATHPSCQFNRAGGRADRVTCAPN